MSSPKRIAVDKVASGGITVKEVKRSVAGSDKTYSTYKVQGWRENGKWQRKQFKDEKEAQRFAAEKRISMDNKGTDMRLLPTFLTEDQLRDAEAASRELGGAYSLVQSAKYYLEHHRAPDFTIQLSSAISQYLGALESEQVTEATIRNRKSVLGQLLSELDNPLMHKIRRMDIKAYLDGLRSKDGTKAKLKTFNNYRNDLNLFFRWCCEDDPEDAAVLASNRPWCWGNPVEKIKPHEAKKVAKQKAPIHTTEVKRLRLFLSSLMNWQDGAMVKYYALVYFAGIRPDEATGEMGKLAKRESELINLKTNTIHIPASVSKTGYERDVDISPNLKKWLVAYKDYPIIPSNYDRMQKLTRRSLKLTHDETRHSFISYHVALHRSMGEAALQAGNSESIVKRNYYKKHTREEGAEYFSIAPDMDKLRAVTG